MLEVHKLIGGKRLLFDRGSWGLGNYRLTFSGGGGVVRIYHQAAGVRQGSLYDIDTPFDVVDLSAGTAAQPPVAFDGSDPASQDLDNGEVTVVWNNTGLVDGTITFGSGTLLYTDDDGENWAEVPTPVVTVSDGTLTLVYPEAGPLPLERRYEAFYTQAAVPGTPVVERRELRLHQQKNRLGYIIVADADVTGILTIEEWETIAGSNIPWA